MHTVNSTLVETGRGGYESFDCAQAVALIGFLGLISNFQDIIETFTNNMNKRKRRRRNPNGILNSLSQLMQIDPWESLQPVINMVSWASDKTENQILEDHVYDDLVVDPPSDTKPEGVTPFVNDIAMFGPQLALWVVDTADGRISGEEGRKGICKTIDSMQENHGFSGSVFGNLLTQTVAKAMASHSPAEKLLQKASLLDSINPCWAPRRTDRGLEITSY